MGTKNNPGNYDCHAAAGPDEPVFTLRSTDALAGKVVRYWAEQYRARKMKHNGRLTPQQQRKHDEALACAKAMDEWHEKHAGLSVPLPERWILALQALPESGMGSHEIDVTLKNGETVQGVVVADGRTVVSPAGLAVDEIESIRTARPHDRAS